MAVLTVDLSRWDGTVSIPKLQQAGVGAVIAKCGGGDQGLYTDSKWESNYANCKAAKCPVGAYWYMGATTVDRAKEEAAYCLKLLNGKQLEYPVYVDVEERAHQQMSTNQPGTLAKVICAFADALSAAGYMPGVYSWKWLLEPCGFKVAALEWWVCAWTKAKPCECGMWQFGGETNLLRPTTVAGYKDMDQSYAYRDYPSIIKAAGLNGFKKEVGTTKPGKQNSTFNTDRFPASKTVRFAKKTAVRDRPSINPSAIVSHYGVGESCIVDGYVLSDGYVWGTYIGRSSGKRRYVSLGTTDRVIVA